MNFDIRVFIFLNFSPMVGQLFWKYSIFNKYFIPTSLAAVFKQPQGGLTDSERKQERTKKCKSVLENKASNFMGDEYATYKYHSEYYLKMTKNENLHGLQHSLQCRHWVAFGQESHSALSWTPITNGSTREVCSQTFLHRMSGLY